MQRICPNPSPWNDVFNQLCQHASQHTCVPAKPPMPLILGGWVGTGDHQKQNRWGETLEWAYLNGCSDLVESVPDEDFYEVYSPTDRYAGYDDCYTDMYWDVEPKRRPSDDELTNCLQDLRSRWTEIAGERLAKTTRPGAFTGRKSRRLLVVADGNSKPPWGEWDRLSDYRSDRLPFRVFRATINKAIAPHFVDHIDFDVTQPYSQLSPDA